MIELEIKAPALLYAGTDGTVTILDEAPLEDGREREIARALIRVAEQNIARADVNDLVGHVEVATLRNITERQIP